MIGSAGAAERKGRAASLAVEAMESPPGRRYGVGAGRYRVSAGRVCTSSSPNRVARTHPPTHSEPDL